MSESVEGALWTAVRVLEESAALERRLAGDAASRGDQFTADRFADAATGTRVPVFALGGLARDAMTVAIAHGAHGIAMRRHAWPDT